MRGFTSLYVLLVIALLSKCMADISATMTQEKSSQVLSAEIEGSFNEDFKTAADLNEPSISTVLGNVPIIPPLSETVDSLLIEGQEVEFTITNNVSDDDSLNNQTAPKITEEVNTTADQDNIPSFSEWTQKQLAERKRNVENGTGPRPTVKIRRKNYASPDCGAKIVAANPESVSASSVLTSSRDEYMLNHCSTRIWFVIELCEAIQAQQLDLANFELFSSSPREFSVYLSNRFPTRDWSSVGKFTAHDSRDIQSFTLSPLLFGKFIKVEVQSHYGHEHYCPLSWVRVFGTSEYEVLATEDETRTGQDDGDVEEEGDDDRENGGAPRNLLSSATQAVLTIVRKATAPFRRDEVNNQGQPAKPSTSTSTNCICPRYLTVCDNCSQHIYDNLFYLLSCDGENLYHLSQKAFIRNKLIYTDMCQRFGLDFVSLRKGAPYPMPLPPKTKNYLTALFRESYAAALCNVMAVSESRVLINNSFTEKPVNESYNIMEDCQKPKFDLLSSSTCGLSDFSTKIVEPIPPKITSDVIKPTKTFKEDMDLKIDSVTIEPIDLNLETITPQIVEEVENVSSLAEILHDLSELEQAVTVKPSGDSIFLRLANRIKNLEINMSLSSSYLEEMSRRYRIQLEGLSKLVNLTAAKVDEISKNERNARNEEMAALKDEMACLKQELSQLVSDRRSWLPRPTQIPFYLLHTLIIWLIFCHRNPPPTQQPPPPKRTISVVGVPGHEGARSPLERRPSDDAFEVTVTQTVEPDRKRRRKRKEHRKTSGAEMKPSKRQRADHEDELDVLRNFPDPSGDWRQDNIPIQSRLPPDISTFNRFAMFESPEPTAKPAEPAVRRFSSPTFMKTALSQRADRPQIPNPKLPEPYSLTATTVNPSENNPKINNHKKEKKESSLRKYVKKLF